jgi:hypothetical protein
MAEQRCRSRGVGSGRRCRTRRWRYGAAIEHPASCRSCSAIRFIYLGRGDLKARALARRLRAAPSGRTPG